MYHHPSAPLSNSYTYNACPAIQQAASPCAMAFGLAGPAEMINGAQEHRFITTPAGVVGGGGGSVCGGGGGSGSGGGSPCTFDFARPASDLDR